MSIRSLAPPKNVEPALEPLIAGFLDWARVERGFAAETISTYRRSLERFFTEANTIDVERISPGDVLRFKRLLMNRECSPSYIAGMVLALRSFLTYCGQVRGLMAVAVGCLVQFNSGQEHRHTRRLRQAICLAFAVPGELHSASPLRTDP